MLKHKIRILVKNPNIKEAEALKAGERKIHRRFLNWMLGEEMNILVISPGSSVKTVEIKEIVAEE